jgi:hypothetical protein
MINSEKKDFMEYKLEKFVLASKNDRYARTGR